MKQRGENKYKHKGIDKGTTITKLKNFIVFFQSKTRVCVNDSE